MMTKLLEQAIEQLRELPEDEQDAAADVLFAYVSSDERQCHLRPNQISQVRHIQQRLRSGETRLATAAETAAVKKKTGL